jgi:hypothetical protein
MALFKDGHISGIEDLTDYDSQLLTLASAENIDVDRKLTLAQKEIGMEIAALLNRAGQGLTPGSITETDCDSLVVTPALKLWHTFRALELVYRDAYDNQLNDRFAGKRDSFKERAHWARERLLELGIGVAFAPVPQAAAPSITTVDGALEAGTYYVSMSWLNERGQEGAHSAPAVAYIQQGTFQACPGDTPQGVTGWNVYAGHTSETMARQNCAPLGLSSAWTQPGQIAAGPAPSMGQSPDVCVPVTRVLERG